MRVNEYMRAIRALAELDVAPTQQVHQEEPMVKERHVNLSLRRTPGENLRVGIVFGPKLNFLKDKYGLTITLEAQTGFLYP
jgi:hypothetical protein